MKKYLAHRLFKNNTGIYLPNIKLLEDELGKQQYYSMYLSMGRNFIMLPLLI